MMGSILEGGAFWRREKGYASFLFGQVP